MVTTMKLTTSWYHSLSIQHAESLIMSKFEPVCEVINHLKTLPVPRLSVTEIRNCSEHQDAIEDMEVLESIQVVAESMKKAACTWVSSSGC